MWRRYAAGDLECAPSSVLLDKGQRDWVTHFWADTLPAVWLVGRQRGKSFTALLMALEFGLRTHGAVIRYCALTKDSAVGIVEPILAVLLEHCPKDIRPRMVSSPDDEEDGIIQRRRLWFPTSGAELVIFGTDAQSFRKGRGPRTHLQLFDECGFYQDMLKVEEALRPGLQTTRGRSLYLSSPPESPGHPFVTRVNAAAGTGRLIRDTFWNNPRIDQEAIIREEASLRGQTREEFIGSTYFLREYEAKIVTETSRAAAPAWTDEVAAACTLEWPRPAHYDGYTGHDWGGQTGDPHAALFGFCDYAASKLVIEYESEERGIDTKELASRWREIETESWGPNAWDGTLLGASDFDRNTKQLPEFLRKAISDKAPRQPYLRVVDSNQQQLQKDMIVDHGYALLPTEKHDKHLVVDKVNVLIREGRIIVNPRCKRLLEQLRTTLWDKTRSGWERTPKDHGDLIDCLVYLVRNIRWHRDPRPPGSVVRPDSPVIQLSKEHPLKGLFSRGKR